MRCTACDRINAGDARFCVGCGTPLAYAVRPAPTAMGMSSPNMATMPTMAASQPTTPSGSAMGYAAPPVSPAYQAYAYPPAVQVVNNITMPSVTMPAPAPVVVLQQHGGPNLLIRALWFLFIGLWLGAVCTALAWALNLTIIGLPLGLYIINRLPQIMTLKPVPLHVQVTVQNGVTIVRSGAVPQYPFTVRALYFLTIGWWASGLWLLMAWTLVGATLGLGLPLAFWMFNRTPLVTTLAR